MENRFFIMEIFSHCSCEEFRDILFCPWDGYKKFTKLVAAGAMTSGAKNVIMGFNLTGFPISSRRRMIYKLRIVFRDGDTLLMDARDFDPAQTLECGQCFRWDRLPDGSWRGVAGGRVCRLSCREDAVVLHGVSREDFSRFWRGYFDLDTDYGAIRAQISRDPVLRRAAAFAPGLRILRQDGWEALCSFILSQNNNIGRIKGLVERLCRHFGEPLGGDDYDFPRPERLAPLEPEDLAPVRCGFRARYVIDAARKVAGGQVDLKALPSMPLDEARECLRRIDGVGPKVADCALLFGFGRMECLPVDVWIGRAMDRLFAGCFPECALPWAGIAQQYLFHYVRRCPGALDKEPAGKASF